MDLNVVTAVFSGVVALSTVVYAILTWKLTSETRKMREIQTTPNVLVTIESETEKRSLYFVVKNIGLAPAYNIKFNINPDLLIVKGYPLSKVGFIRNGLSILAPGQELKTLLFIKGSEEFKNQIDSLLNIQISYESISRDQLYQKYQIDLSQFKGMVYTSGYSQYENELIRKLDSIQKGLEQINNNGISAIAYKSIDKMEEDREKNNEKRIKEIENMKKEKNFKKDN